MNKIKRGFTLIELLVVIAIIAILAAILFPVFAQAKAAAKATAALSNTKQLDLGIIMYENDYDDTFPVGTEYMNVNDHWELGIKSVNLYWATWGWEIAPYLKTGALFMDPTTNGLSGTQSVVAFQAFYTQFGYNFEFLSPFEGPSSAEYSVPATATSGADPANTVTLASKWNSADNTTGYIYSSGTNGMWVDAAAEGVVCDSLNSWCLSDWGQGDITDTAAAGGVFGVPQTDGRYTDGNAYRVANHVTTAFVDGHSKSLPYQGLSAGTNFNFNALPGTAGAANGVVVTSAAKYLWSLGKTCADFAPGTNGASGLPNCAP